MKIRDLLLILALCCFHLLCATDTRLILQLSSGMVEERSNAAYLLGTSKDLGAVDLLLHQLIEESDSMNRLMIVESIRKLNLPRGYLGLLKAFQGETDPLVKRKIIEAIGDSRDKQFVFLIDQFLKSQNPSDQKSAILALGSIPHASSVRALRKYLTSSNEPLQKKLAIGAIAKQPTGEGVSFLIEFGNLSSEESDRAIIAEALADVHEKEVQKALLSWIVEARQRSTVTRLIKSLQLQGSSSAVPSLYELLQFHGPSTQIELIEAMLAIDRDSAVPYLQTFYSQSVQTIDPNLQRLEALQLLRLHKLLRQNLGTVDNNPELYPIIWQEDPILHYIISTF